MVVEGGGAGWGRWGGGQVEKDSGMLLITWPSSVSAAALQATVNL